VNKVQLKVFQDDRLIETRTLDQKVIKIGRLEQSDVCLQDDRIARMHAVIEVNDSDLRLVDLGSATGTIVNGQRVDKNMRLSSGDQIELGSYRFEVSTPSQTAAAVAPAPVPPTPAPRPVPHVDVSEVERSDATVTEVMALYGKTVLDVQHVDQVQARHKSAPGLMMLGGLLLLAGGTLFGTEVANDWDGHRAAVQQAAETGRPAPAAPGHGLGGLGLVLALAGLVPFSIGNIRRRDRGLASYTIGENPEATFHAPVLGSPDGEFPLVRGRHGGGATLNFTEGMTGEVEVGGHALSLANLAQSGRASRIGSSYRFPLPRGARCRVQYGGLTFLVNEVAAGRKIARKSEADKPFWLYNAASLAAVGSLLVLTHLVPEDALAMNSDDRVSQNRFVGFIHQPDVEQEDPPTFEENADDQEAGGQGQRAAGEEGKMGNPIEKASNRAYAMKKRPNTMPQLARNFNPEVDARQAGILGMMKEDSGHFLSSPYGGEFASGSDDEDVWGNMTGTEIGSAFGMGGTGVIGNGRGGGGSGEGTLGMGNVGLIGHSAGGGNGLEYGRGNGSGFNGKNRRQPKVRASIGKVHGALDRDIIRRIVRAHINEVRHCYNEGLVGNPNLKGRVSVMFAIGPTGKVKTSAIQESSLKDRDVANCVAKAVRRWKFPRPDNAGSVMVTYPFVLSPG
jgi:hypothetical protein